MDIYEEIRRNLLGGKADEVVNLIRKAIAVCYPPESVLKEGLILGVDTLAYKFRNSEVCVPEALRVARALNAGLRCLTPYLDQGGARQCTAVIGTVEGDVHDIGKNLVKIYLSTLNIDMVDLGVDVSKEEFVEAAVEHDARLVMASAQQHTTVCELKGVIEKLTKAGIRDKVIVFVGGLSVSKEYAEEIGADYYTRDAIELRDFLNKNLSKLLKEI